MKCKFCGAEVKLGERCQYCGSVAEAFMAGFKFKNNLFPDENARCYQEHKGEERERTDEENRMLKKAAFFAGFMDGNQPPRALIGEPEEED